MGTLSPPMLPLIDFCKSDLKPGSTGWDSLQKEVLKALEEYGCFEALYDKISVDLQNDVFQQLEDLFNLPAETKRRFVHPGNLMVGYLMSRPQSPLLQSMGIGGVLDPGAMWNLANLMWPHGNPKFCETLNSYVVGVLELDQLITTMVLRSFGLEKYMDSHAKSLNHGIRVSKYEAPMTEEPQLAARSHYDKAFMTTIKQNHVDGLEVETKDGKWFQVAPSSSTFIVIAGESLLAWSNGRLHCPRHRVMMSGNEARYSILKNSSIRGVIKCPQELVDERHPLLFKPFEEDDLHQVYETKQKVKPESTVKTYFGV